MRKEDREFIKSMHNEQSCCDYNMEPNEELNSIIILELQSFV